MYICVDVYMCRCIYARMLTCIYEYVYIAYVYNIHVYIYIYLYIFMLHLLSIDLDTDFSLKDIHMCACMDN